MKTFLAIALFGFALFTTDPVLSSEVRATPEEAKGLLSRAVEKVTKDGPEAAFTSFNDPKGNFKVKELYVFAFDLNGKYMASGANPMLVGTDAIDVKDANGTPVVREIIELGKAKGHGEVKYIWLNRVTNKVEKKNSFIQRLGNYVLGVGFYQN